MTLTQVQLYRQYNTLLITIAFPFNGDMDVVSGDCQMSYVRVSSALFRI